MDRSQKQELVAQMQDRLQDASAIIVTRQTGLSVSEATELRRSIREAGAEFKVLKNTLAKLALKGTKFEALKDLMSGPTGIAFSQDPIGAAKASVKFADDNDKFEVVGGMLDQKILEVGDVKALAKLPSLDELRGKIIGVISAPATKLAVLAKEPAGGLARVLNARGQQSE